MTTPARLCQGLGVAFSCKCIHAKGTPQTQQFLYNAQVPIAARRHQSLPPVAVDIDSKESLQLQQSFHSALVPLSARHLKFSGVFCMHIRAVLMNKAKHSSALAWRR